MRAHVFQLMISRSFNGSHRKHFSVFPFACSFSHLATDSSSNSSTGGGYSISSLVLTHSLELLLVVLISYFGVVTDDHSTTTKQDIDVCEREKKKR